MLQEKTITILKADILQIKSDSVIFVSAWCDDSIADLNAQFTLTTNYIPIVEHSSTVAPNIYNTPTHSSTATKECTNCHKQIPLESFQMHEIFCERNNIACKFPGCDKVYLRSQEKSHLHCPDCGVLFSTQGDLSDHQKTFHTSMQCLACGAIQLSLPTLRIHRRTSCPKRVIKCRFCGDSVYSEGDPDDIRDKVHWNLTRHESHCGNRTSICEICKRSVRLKELNFHMLSHDPSYMPYAISDPIQDLHPKPMLNPSAEQTQYPNLETNTSVTEQEEEGEYFCPICNEMFPLLRKLNSHLDTAHFSG
jgi:uncharacterized C2H2 Zn-finger protein